MLKRKIEEENIINNFSSITLPYYYTEMAFQSKIQKTLVGGTRSKKLLYNSHKVIPILDQLIEVRGFKEIAPPEPTELISVEQGSDYWKIFRMYKPEEEENHLFFNSTFLAKILTRSRDYVKLYNNYLGLEKIPEPNDFVKNLFELGKRGEILALQKFRRRNENAGYNGIYKGTIYRPGPMVRTFNCAESKITIQASLDAIVVDRVKYYEFNPIIIEVKTWCKDSPIPQSVHQIPEEYLMQIYFQLIVSELVYAYLLIYDITTDKMAVFLLSRNDCTLDDETLPRYLGILRKKNKITTKSWELLKVNPSSYISGQLSNFY